MGLSDEASTRKIVLIRADAGRRIGSGHVMRCSAIAQEIRRLGGEVLFVVSNEESACFVRCLGFSVRVLQSDPLVFTQEDASRLTALASEVSAECILVDSYAVTDEFFNGLTTLKQKQGWIAYIDDLYTFQDGCYDSPRPRPVDVVVNYSFSASEAEYRRAYRRMPVVCLIGPRYAPIRDEFRCKPAPCRPEVQNILVTSGSTNQNRLLESLAEACLNSAPQANISIVVGKLASYEGPSGERISVLRNISEMAPLMKRSDLALSAAGSTLYELAAIGVPTIAIASTENQALNVKGFNKLDLGPVFYYRNSRFVDNLEPTIASLVDDSLKRGVMSTRGSEIVDGQGARRIALELFRKTLDI